MESRLTSIRPYTRNSLGDTEMILEFFLSKRPSYQSKRYEAVPSWILSGLKQIYAHCVGSFACIIFIPGYGLVAFRDPNGIKPLVMGERVLCRGERDIMFASETAAFRTTGFSYLQDVHPGVFEPSFLLFTL